MLTQVLTLAPLLVHCWNGQKLPVAGRWRLDPSCPICSQWWAAAINPIVAVAHVYIGRLPPLVYRSRANSVEQQICAVIGHCSLTSGQNRECRLCTPPLVHQKISSISAVLKWWRRCYPPLCKCHFAKMHNSRSIWTMRKVPDDSWCRDWSYSPHNNSIMHE